MAILPSLSTKLPALFLAISLFHGVVRPAATATNSTKGFVAVPLKKSNFEIQRPYDLALAKRYSFKDGVHKLWVYSNDLPHSLDSHTRPRTEIRIRGYDYSSGVWQFEGHGYVPKGTTGVAVMQVFGAAGHATTAMIRVYNGSLYYYRHNLLSPDIYDRWFKLNVIHDVEVSRVEIYVDNELKLTTRGQSGKNHFFKCGVYTQDDASRYLESRWKEIRILRREA
ncbi:hypothetical protein MLD38_012202 [Melastoma candidum]|uniref:Uncharacterized protein n=1 Tax=Melastoma candidum TaxID=119954 RepID=A0ACB9R9S7_9MYRT|nr:hypothetical protein MLD38_012202 [Melastoma candidum]